MHFICEGNRCTLLVFYLWRKQRYSPSILFVEEAEVPSWHFIGEGSRGTLLVFYLWRKLRYPPGILLEGEAAVTILTFY
jgi:hypothetical protein